MGTGHSCAAEAILYALNRQGPDLETQVVNSFQYASQRVGKMVEDGYLQLLQSFPTLYGLLYENRESPNTVSGVRRWLTQLFAGNFELLLDSYRPDVVVCTHAFPFGVMSVLRERRGWIPPCIGVVTDFVVHPHWAQANMDRYAVATPELLPQLTGRGIPESAVRVTGIPIDTRFSERPQVAALRERMGLGGGLPVILVMGGGLGMGPVGRVLRSLRRISEPTHVVVLTGKNEKLKARLEAEAVPLAHLPIKVQVLGYVHNVYDYMHAADLLVTKPGGMTSAEALACGLPMVILHPLPGPEMRNAKYLLARRVAVRANNERGLHNAIHDLLQNRSQLERMRALSVRAARPDSARHIAEWVLSLLPTEGRPAQPDASLEVVRR